MRVYPEYKDSGNEWIGLTPEHWQIIRFRYIFTLGKGLSITKANLEESGIPCVNYGEIHSKFGFELDTDRHILKCVNEKYIKASPKSLLNKGDVVFADTSEDLEGSGNFTQLLSENITFAGYHTVIARPVAGNNERYLAYVLDSISYRNQIRTSVKGVKVFSITRTILKDTLLQLPSYIEQQAIANYLDRKTARIDKLISEKQNFIKLLKEKRQALISHVVTKGLDPHVKMKESGIEWIGKVPEHWYISKLSYRYEVLLGKMLDDKKITGDYLGHYLRNTDVQWDHINDKNLPKMDFRPQEIERYQVVKGDLLVCEGGEVGRCAIWDKDETCFYQKALHRLRPYSRSKDFPRFMFYVLSNAVHQERFMSRANKATIAHLPADAFRQYRFGFPSFDEQKLIADYLDKMKYKYDTLLSEVNQSIELLKEHRTALISAAVTGKIDVRDHAK